MNLFILEFSKEKRERQNTKVDHHSRMISFLRFRNKLRRICDERSGTYTNMEPCQATYSAPLDRFSSPSSFFSFLLSFYRNLLRRMSRDFVSKSRFGILLESKSKSLDVQRDLSFLSPFFHVVSTVNNAVHVNRALKKMRCVRMKELMILMQEKRR